MAGEHRNPAIGDTSHDGGGSPYQENLPERDKQDHGQAQHQEVMDIRPEAMRG